MLKAVQRTNTTLTQLYTQGLLWICDMWMNHVECWNQFVICTVSKNPEECLVMWFITTNPNIKSQILSELSSLAIKSRICISKFHFSRCISIRESEDRFTKLWISFYISSYTFHLLFPLCVSISTHTAPFKISHSSFCPLAQWWRSIARVFFTFRCCFTLCVRMSVK